MANHKTQLTRKLRTVRIRMTHFEYTRLTAMARQFTNGNVSALIRHAIESMNRRPKRR